MAISGPEISWFPPEMDLKRSKLPIIDTIWAVTLVLVDLEPWDMVCKLSNGSTGNGNQLISAGNGPKTAKIDSFFQKFPKSNLGFAWSCKFLKNSSCKPWFWALFGKKLLEFDLFFAPPWIFPAKQGFTAVLYMNFLPKSWNFPKIFFCLLENQLLLAKSLENFAWKRW